jgi:acyl carrier protein
LESNGDSEPDEKTAKAQNEFADNVLAIVLKLAEEVSPQLRRDRIVALDSDLDRDIGLDSLARSELVFRLDKEFSVKLPDRVLVEAATPRDLLIALKNAKPALLTPKALHQSKYSGLKQINEPIGAATLIEAFQFHVDLHPERPHLKIWLSEDHEENFTYGELHREALKIAKGLIDLGVVARDRVAIMLGTDPTFFSSFMGTLYSGAIPVPIYPPFRPSQIEDHLRRQAGILLNARAKILLIGGEMQSIGSLLYGLVSDHKSIDKPEKNYAN